VNNDAKQLIVLATTSPLSITTPWVRLARPYGKSAWSGKPSAVVSASPGGIGGFGANHHLRQSLVFLNVPAMAQPEAYIRGANKLFDADGKLVNDATRKFLQRFTQAYAARIVANRELWGIPRCELHPFVTLLLRRVRLVAMANRVGYLGRCHCRWSDVVPLTMHTPYYGPGGSHCFLPEIQAYTLQLSSSRTNGRQGNDRPSRRCSPTLGQRLARREPSAPGWPSVMGLLPV
jgi:hypothetical protein